MTSSNHRAIIDRKLSKTISCSVIIYLFNNISYLGFVHSYFFIFYITLFELSMISFVLILLLFLFIRYVDIFFIFIFSIVVVN